MNSTRQVSPPSAWEYRPPAEADGWRHWCEARRYLNMPALTISAALVLLALLTVLHVRAGDAQRFYLEMSRAVNYRDMSELNEYGDYVLQRYLTGQ